MKQKGGLGIALFFPVEERKIFDDLISGCRKAVIYNPKFTEAYAHIGLIEHLNGNEKKAYDAYRMALMLKSQGPLPKSAQAMPMLPFARPEAFAVLGHIMQDRRATLPHHPRTRILTPRPQARGR